MSFLFLAAWTPRSQAYAQAMAKAGIKPEQTILYGDPAGALHGQKDIGKIETHAPALFIPDFSEKLGETCKNGGWSVQKIKTSNLNDDVIFDAINYLKPELIVCSLCGRQIVGEKLLSLAPFLHIHCGWLPDYKGSTTIYYSILKEKMCGVSAILLEKEIDTGKIVAKKKYPIPPKGIDIDYVYDNAIRGDLLVEALKSREKWIPIKQPEGGTMYYVIHPVLKHLAYLKVEKQ